MFGFGEHSAVESVGDSAVRDGGNFVDAGCCFGQVLRFLVHNEQIPAGQLYGFDLEQGFVDYGYELFNDRDRLDSDMTEPDD